MFKKVAPYMGEYKKYTALAAIMMCIGIVANILPYFINKTDCYRDCHNWTGCASEP